uniref:Uncharacterized protein n=1 Tax=Moniliophthora roreri TaxID=221103 RepID=A0A0W0GFK7_MONRR
MTHWRFVFASRDCAGATDMSNKRKKVIESAGDIVGNLINIDPGHVTDTGRYRIFYGCVQISTSRYLHLSHYRSRRCQGNLESPRTSKSTSQVIPTSHNSTHHTATALAIVGKAVPVMVPGKAAAVALAKIVELAKTAQGNKDEALRLSKRAEDVGKRLLKRLDRAKNPPPEALAEIGKDIQLLQSFLDNILSALLRLQKPTRNRVKAFLFAKDHKDELGQLQRKLDDGFRAFSAKKQPSVANQRVSPPK